MISQEYYSICKEFLSYADDSPDFSNSGEKKNKQMRNQTSEQRSRRVGLFILHTTWSWTQRLLWADCYIFTLEKSNVRSAPFVCNMHAWIFTFFHPFPSLSVNQRQCRFTHESDVMIIAPVYSFNFCHNECRLKFALKMCNCIPHFYRPNGKNNLCK